MKILSIDTSSKICSVSILEDTTVILEKHTNDEKTHSQNLMPLIDELFKDANLTLDNIDLLACSQGPGSFTGIRIGIATIKAFADAKNIPVVGVTSLESLAYNITESGLIVSLIDEKNDNVYYSLFSNNGTTYTQIGDFKSCSIHDILSDLSSKIEEISLKQDYLEENIEYIDNDLTDIQDELFEEVSFDDLNSIEDEYVEIKCDNCDKPLFVEQQALNNNSSIH